MRSQTKQRQEQLNVDWLDSLTLAVKGGKTRADSPASIGPPCATTKPQRASAAAEARAIINSESQLC